MSKHKSEVKSGDYQQMLRERLQQLTERYQQAEIAARTGTPTANVHRYLKAGKIPSEFLAAIVEHFDIDSEWLLTGKGEAASSSVKTETAAKAGELLDLVKTMNAISRMRLGAIVNDKDRKLMRELGDALRSFDRLREKMNQQSRPVMKQLVDELRQCLHDMDTDRARIIAQTAVELSRICLDDELLLQLDAQLAGVAYLTGELETAVSHDRKVFARRIANGVIQSPEEIASCTNLVMLLRDSGHGEESRRIGKAVLALIPDHDQPVPALNVLKMMLSMMDVEAGEVAKGLARCQKIWPTLEVGRRISETVIMLRIYTLTGTMSYFEAAMFGDESKGKSRTLVRWAALQENAKALKHAVSNFIGETPELIASGEYDAQFARLLERVLSDKKAGIKDFDKLADDYPPVAPNKLMVDLLLAVHRAQVARLCGDIKTLKAMATESIRCIGKINNDSNIRVDFWIVHLRNMKAITGKVFTEQIAELQLKLNEQVKNGFHGLKDLV